MRFKSWLVTCKLSSNLYVFRNTNDIIKKTHSHGQYAFESSGRNRFLTGHTLTYILHKLVKERSSNRVGSYALLPNTVMFLLLRAYTQICQNQRKSSNQFILHTSYQKPIIHKQTSALSSNFMTKANLQSWLFPLNSASCFNNFPIIPKAIKIIQL